MGNNFIFVIYRTILEVIVALKFRTKPRMVTIFERQPVCVPRKAFLKPFKRGNFASMQQLKTTIPFDELMLALLFLERPP